MRTFAPLVAFFASFVTATNADCNGPNARIKPSPGAIVVDCSGKYFGSVCTISAAINKWNSEPNKTEIFIMAGTYPEQLRLDNVGASLVIRGYTCDSTDYASNQVTITQSTSQNTLSPEIIKDRNDFTSTLSIKVANLRMYNINLVNTAGNTGQALAVMVNVQTAGFYACKFIGYQDTVCANEGRQLYARSYIEGAVDFIFGQKALAWFDTCVINAIGKGRITANGRNDASNPSIFVINKAQVSGNKLSRSPMASVRTHCISIQQSR